MVDGAYWSGGWAELVPTSSAPLMSVLPSRPTVALGDSNATRGGAPPTDRSGERSTRSPLNAISGGCPLLRFRKDRPVQTVGLAGQGAGRIHNNI